MLTTVRLGAIIEALELQSGESYSFLDLDTGQVEIVSRELLNEAESGDDEEPDRPAWQEEEWETARRIVFTGRFKKLPTKFDIHEWAIMQDFSHSVQSDRSRKDLLDAIHGPGAFRNFQSALRRHQIESAWFQFRSEALRQIALDWCEEHHITWE